MKIYFSFVSECCATILTKKVETALLEICKSLTSINRTEHGIYQIHRYILIHRQYMFIYVDILQHIAGNDGACSGKELPQLQTGKICIGCPRNWRLSV